MNQIPQVGEQIVVYGNIPPAKVSAVETDKETQRTKIGLDWGDRGKSYVWLHDEGEVWYRFDQSN